MKSPIILLTGALSLAACALPPVNPKPSALPGSAPATDSSATAPTTSPAGFDQTLSLQGVSFRVTSTNAGSLNRLRIQPQGLKRDNTAIEKDIDGTVTGAEVADLNVDGSPEIYVYATSAGSGSLRVAGRLRRQHRKILERNLPAVAAG